MKKILFSISVFTFTLIFCQSKKETELLNLDKAFAQMSHEKGIKLAFQTYFSENPTTFPYRETFLKDRSKIIDNYSKLTALDWVPLDAEISKSNDLGYTYGIGKITINKDGKNEVSYSHYVSIWKKNKNNQWKLILDTGNDCSEEVGKKYFKD